MTEEVINVAVSTITADKDLILTNGTSFSSVGGTVWLSSNDKAENWREITQEEYEKILKEKEESLKVNTNEKI